MSASFRPILSDQSDTWVKVPYQVKFGNEITTMMQALKFYSGFDGDSIKTMSTQSTAMGGELLDEENMAAFFNTTYPLNRPSYKDTRLGANDAMNCQWQFNRDDDIVPRINYSDGGDSLDEIGMGRVYAKTVNQWQTIMEIGFGLPRFSNLKSFYLSAFDRSIMTLMSTGYNVRAYFEAAFTALFVAAGTIAFGIPFMAATWIFRFITNAKSLNVNKFYDLRLTMHLYYRFVDVIMAKWMINVGMMKSGSGVLGDVISADEDSDEVPLATRATGITIFDIMQRKALTQGKYKNKLSREEYTSKLNELLNKEWWEVPQSFFTSMDIGEDGRVVPKDPYDTSFAGSKKGRNPWDSDLADWVATIWDTALGATQFVGFRIEKSTDASESFSNSSGPSPFAEKINQMSQENATKRFDFMKVVGGEYNTGIETLDAVANGASTVIGAATDALAGLTKLDGLTGLTEAIINGGAYIDIPESYRSSDFGKSHSINLKLQAPYGDLSTIRQTIVIPLAMILAGALPRATGANSYTQPFLCRVYVKGMFAIPLALIESVNIRRGSSEFGWNRTNLPTVIEVSIGFKDLSPAMYMTLDDGNWNIFGGNDSFTEYMMTLSGLGLFDRISRLAQMKRSLQLRSYKLRNHFFNGAFHSSWMGDSAIMTAISSILPWTTMSRN